MPHCSTCHRFLTDAPYTDDDGDPQCTACHEHGPPTERG